MALNHNLTTNFSHMDDLFQLIPEKFNIIGLFMSTCCLFGITGNLLVIVVFIRKRSVRRPINLFVLNLACSDIIVAAVGYPMTTISAFANRWMFFDIGCKIYAFICFTCGVSSIMSHAALGYCRYVTICKYGYHKKIQSKTVWLILILIWIFSLFWTLTPLLGWSSYVLELVPISCSINWYGDSLGDVTYVILVILFVYVFPLAIIVFSYSKIIQRRVCTSNRRSQQTEYTPRYQYDLEQRVTLISVSMMIAFLVAWTPYAVFSAMSAAKYTFKNEIAAFPTLFAKASCAFNPIIYAFSNSLFRDTIMQLLAPWRHRRVGVSTLPWPTAVYVQNQGQNGSTSERVDIRFPEETLFMDSATRDSLTQEQLKRLQRRFNISNISIRMEPRSAAVIGSRRSIDFSVI